MGSMIHGPHGTHMEPACPDGARMGTTVQTAYGPQMPHLEPILTIWVPYGQPVWYPCGNGILPTCIPDGPHIFCYLGYGAHMGCSRFSPYLTHKVFPDGPQVEPILAIWDCPYGPHMGLGCKILWDPYGPAHVGPIFEPRWGPHDTHMAIHICLGLPRFTP